MLVRLVCILKETCKSLIGFRDQMRPADIAVLQSHPFEMDPRLPFKFALEIEVRGLRDSCHAGLGVLMLTPDGSSQLLALHIDDVVRWVRGWVFQ